MKKCLFLALLAVLSFPAPLVFSQTIDEYRQRREKVRQSMDEKAILIVRSSLYPDYFKPDKNFYYLTGVAEPGLILVLTRNEEILFLPPRNIEREVWDQKKLYPGEVAEKKTGISQTKPTTDFNGSLDKLYEGKIQLFTSYSSSSESTLPPAIEKFVKKTYGSEMAIKPPSTVTAPLRLIKSETEIANLKKAVEATVRSVKNAMLTMKAGKTENEIQATIDFAFKLHGGTGKGFDGTVGSGPNSVILHAGATDRKMQDGELVVMDVGAEHKYYTADVTRTIPVSGKFTDRQKQIYTIVLKAQEECIRSVRKDMTLTDIHQKAVDVIQEELLKIGMIKNKDEYKKYFMHGTCHWLGLDVHDVGDRKSTKLAAGMAFTIEPGIYIAEENLGVRIEDDFLMTEDGCIHLSKDCPRTVEEIEKLMSEAGK